LRRAGRVELFTSWVLKSTRSRALAIPPPRRKTDHIGRFRVEAIARNATDD
jgi:hypothetical protein